MKVRKDNMRVLSIDWDYFIKEDPMLDWGHREAAFFLNQAWAFRRERPAFDPIEGFLKNPDGTFQIVKDDLTKLAPFAGAEEDILNLPCVRGSYNIATAESHLAILKFLEGKTNLEIVNIDAHHDIYYRTKNFKDPDCGEWAGSLIYSGRVKSYTQIYPGWRKEKGYEEGNEMGVARWGRKKLGVNMRMTWDKPIDVIKWNKVDMVFICRSGCWVPPDYDDRFNEFCRRMGVNGILKPRIIGEAA
jgi:hypothetical protein